MANRIIDRLRFGAFLIFSTDWMLNWHINEFWETFTVDILIWVANHHQWQLRDESSINRNCCITLQQVMKRVNMLLHERSLKEANRPERYI